MKKFCYIFVLFSLFVSCKPTATIITSKTLAKKRGIYISPKENRAPSKIKNSETISKVNEVNSFDGILKHYSNPQTGGHVMQTMGASMQLLPAGFKGKAHKHTGSFVYQCAKGKGYSIINGQRFDWKERDIFCLPSWAWHEHINLSDTEDACLFSFNDLPVIQSLGLFQSKELEENNGFQLQ